MNDRYLFRGKRVDNGEWVQGFFFIQSIKRYDVACIGVEGLWPTPYCDIDARCYDAIDSTTLGQCTGRPDKNGALIFEGDITRLVLPNGEVRYFEVAIKTVTREVVSHPNFDDPTSTVSITGVVFLWQGYELFPCVDEYGVSDIAKMEVVGNIHDTPELLKEDNYAQID